MSDATSSAYAPTDRLYLWLLTLPEEPAVIGEFDLVRSLQGVSLHYTDDWIERGFPLSEDLMGGARPRSPRLTTFCRRDRPWAFSRCASARTKATRHSRTRCRWRRCLRSSATRRSRRSAASRASSTTGKRTSRVAA